MECKKVERLLSSYLDNSLKITYRDEIKEHLAKCQKCMNELNTMTKIDSLIKLKVKEKPSKEYWESYWGKLKSKLDRTMIPRLSENNRRLFNLSFPPKFSSAFSGILIALLILMNGFLYMSIRELTSSIVTISKGEEKIQKQFIGCLTGLDKSVVIDIR